MSRAFRSRSRAHRRAWFLFRLVRRLLRRHPWLSALAVWLFFFGLPGLSRTESEVSDET